jgi:hypothetical protein
MAPPTFDDLVNSMRDGLPHDQRMVYVHLVRWLATETPVSLEQLAAARQYPRDEVMVAMHQLPTVEYDREGYIVGAGLSLVPMPHQLHPGGQTLFTWYALDALAYPVLHEHSARIVPPCPVKGKMLLPICSGSDGGRVRGLAHEV